MQTWHTDMGYLTVVVECCTFLSKGSFSHPYIPIKPLPQHWDSDHLHIKNTRLVKVSKSSILPLPVLNHKQVSEGDIYLQKNKRTRIKGFDPDWKTWQGPQAKISILIKLLSILLTLCKTSTSLNFQVLIPGSSYTVLLFRA